MASEREFSQSVREALLRDEQLVRLLGGTNVFEGYEAEASEPHINICESHSHIDWAGEVRDQDAIVTLQVWSHSGQKSSTHKLIDAAERALSRAGLLKPGSRILLQKNFAGARKLPDNGEYHGILRYRVSNNAFAA